MDQKAARKRTLGEKRRELIVAAAQDAFERDGLEGASLRGIAKSAGYTPAAMYFHFESKEALYAEVLRQSLLRLNSEVRAALRGTTPGAARLRAAAMAFFEFYVRNPRDLDLGLHVFRGGTPPKGLTAETVLTLNQSLWQALEPIASAAGVLGATPETSRHVAADLFTYATGLLLLTNTGQLSMFGIDARVRMQTQVEREVAQLAD